MSTSFKQTLWNAIVGEDIADARATNAELLSQIRLDDDAIATLSTKNAHLASRIHSLESERLNIDDLTSETANLKDRIRALKASAEAIAAAHAVEKQELYKKIEHLEVVNKHTTAAHTTLWEDTKKEANELNAGIKFLRTRIEELQVEEQARENKRQNTIAALNAENDALKTRIRGLEDRASVNDAQWDAAWRFARVENAQLSRENEQLLKYNFDLKNAVTAMEEEKGKAVSRERVALGAEVAALKHENDTLLHSETTKIAQLADLTQKVNDLEIALAASQHTAHTLHTQNEQLKSRHVKLSEDNCKLQAELDTSFLKLEKALDQGNRAMQGELAALRQIDGLRKELIVLETNYAGMREEADSMRAEMAALREGEGTKMRRSDVVGEGDEAAPMDGEVANELEEGEGDVVLEESESESEAEVLSEFEDVGDEAEWEEV